ncbi:MAG: autotransporter-associated beta strand repeat-containing protein, partial [Verrucomicrobia bacterium]|nr:autotransporter-associated beta strand repeat-containing protein [Verrucomicrobiota bacterium]
MNTKSALLNSPAQPSRLARGGFFLTAMLLLLQALTGWAQSGTWTNLAGGSWATAANWTNGGIADGTGFTADLGTLNLAADATVTLDGARTIGNLTMGDTTATYFNWILNSGSGGPLTMAVSSGTPTITAKNGAAVVNTVIAGTGGLRLASTAGTGYVQLNAANTYSGGTIVGDNGQISIGNAQAIGSGTLQFTETVGLGQNWVQAAGADRTITNNVEIRCTRFIAANATVAGQTAGNLTLSGNVFLNNSGAGVRDFFCQKNLTLSGSVSGAPGGLNLNAGTLILQGSNTFTNGVSITAGGVSTLNINADAALGNAANGVTFSTHGTLQAGATPITVAAGRTINITNSSIATIDVPTSSYVMTLAGPVTSSSTNGALRKIGTGTLVLDSGAGVTNRLTGLSITGGTNEWRSGNLVLSAAAGVTAGQFTNGFVNAGNFLLTGGNITAAPGNYIFPAGRGADGAGVFTQTGGIFDGGNSTELLGYGISGIFNLNGGTNICGAIQFQTAGSINLNGGVLNLNTIGAATASLPIYFNGGTLKAKQDAVNLIGNSPGGQYPAVFIKNNGAVIDSSTFAVTIPISLQADAGSTGGLTKLGTGTLTLATNSTYTGNTTNTAGLLVLGHTNALGTGTLVLVSNSMLGVSASLNTGSGVTNAVLLAAASTITNASSLKLSGVISGPGALTKTGAGPLTLGAVNTYSGGTTNAAGNLVLNSPGVSLPGDITITAPSAGCNVQLGAAEQIADTAILTFATNVIGRLQLMGFNETIGGVQDVGGTGNRIVEAAPDTTNNQPATLTLNVVGAGAYSFGGYLRDAASAVNSALSITKSGTGTQTFSAAPALVSYSGPTVINDGVLEFSGASSVANSSAITLNGGSVKFSGGGTRSALISGAGNLI